MSAGKRIYLDHNASSPLRPEVRELLLRIASDPLLNPSSIHGSGRRVRRLMDEAREGIAAFIGANPGEIVFTSGGTEANQIAWRAFSRSGARIATTALEHASVLGASDRAKGAGASVLAVRADRSGRLNASDLEKLESDPPELLSLHHANNETGAVYPVGEIALRLKTRGSLIHSDAVQSAGKLDLDVNDLKADYLAVSGHKLGSPSGVGALYIRRGSPFEPLWEGGAQEMGRRTGTENVLGILCMAEACRAVTRNAPGERQRIGVLRDSFERELAFRVDGLEITGAGMPRLCNTSHIRFKGADAESLLIAADLAGLDCSAGSACSSGSLTASHVLLAMGYSQAEARECLRFSLGWSTTEEDVSKALDLLPGLVGQARQAGEKCERMRAQ
jgi:cysteine desulfurase